MYLNEVIVAIIKAFDVEDLQYTTAFRKTTVDFEIKVDGVGQSELMEFINFQCVKGVRLVDSYRLNKEEDWMDATVFVLEDDENTTLAILLED